MGAIKVLSEEIFELEVINSTGRVMVYLSAFWCGPCRILGPIMEKVAEEASFKVFKIDVDDCPKIVKRFSIKGVPVVMVFENGQVLKQIVGLTNKEALLKLGNI